MRKSFTGLIILFSFIFGLLAPIGNTLLFSGEGEFISKVEAKKKKKKKKKVTRAEVTNTWWGAYTSSFDTDFAVVTGVIKNTGKTNIEIGVLTGTFYNSEGVVIGSGNHSYYDGYHDQILTPGEETFAMVDVTDKFDPESLASANIKVSYKKTKKKPKRLEIMNDMGRFDEDTYTVTGEIINNKSKKQLKNIRVLVAFYDSSGNLVDVEEGYPSPDKLKRLEKTSFSVDSLRFNDQINSYRTIGVSWQY